MKRYFFVIYLVFAGQLFCQGINQYSHYFKNDFPGGEVIIDGVQYTVPIVPPDISGLSGVLKKWTSEDGYTHTATALNIQEVNGHHEFRYWRHNEDIKNTLSYSFGIADDGFYAHQHEANYISTVDVTFENSFVGIGNGGTIKVNGANYNLPAADFEVIEPNSITGTALYQVINGIEYIFDHWSDGSTSTSKTINPNANTTLVAHFNSRPINTYRSLHDISAVGEPIVIDWNEHPHPAVTHYKIYRKVKHNGVMGPEVLLGTTSRGTTTYTDDMYVKTRSYEEDLLFYDVRAYYSTEGTYSNIDYFAIYGELGGVTKQNDSTKTTTEITEDYALSNYPNPFNPSTNISFTLPEAQNVKLLVYNLLGEKVKELVNNSMQAGSYTVKWNGDNQSGRRVNSGVYFSVLQTQEKRIVKKMILSK